MTSLLPCKQSYLNDYASNISLTSAANCYIRKGMLNGTIDSYLVVTQDCVDKACKDKMEDIGNRVFGSEDCLFTEAQTGKLWKFSKIKDLCDIPVSKPPSTGTTAKPSAPSPPTDAPSPGAAPTTAPTTAPTSAPKTIAPSSNNAPGSPSNAGESTGSPTVVIQESWFDSNKSAIIGGGIAVIVILIVIVVYMCIRNKKAKQEPAGGVPYTMVQEPQTNQITATKQPTQTTSYTNNSSSTFQSFAIASSEDGALDMCGLEAQRIPSMDVQMVQAVAQGAYGEVWLAEYMGQKVAAKRLLTSKPHTLTELQKFIWEIKLQSKIESQYIVSFVGVTWNKPADIMMLMEFMEGGDLRTVLQNNSNGSFAWPHKLKCALQVANGLVYLHTMDARIIHRDLKSRNVLLNAEGNAKITDFGIARETDDTTMTAGIGTYRWMAPEVLIDGHYSELADIFSFGVIMAELDTEILPYSDLKNASGAAYTDTAIMAKVMVGQLRPSFSNDCPTWYHDLAASCLSLSPQDRPTAMQIAYQLRTRLDAMSNGK